MYLKRLLMAMSAITLCLTSLIAQQPIKIVGSWTVNPFSTSVADDFYRSHRGKLPAPLIETTGTGNGMKLFCSGVGDEHPDIANASRRIKTSELQQCEAAGVTTIEMPVGYDGVVIASKKTSKASNFTPRQLFLALAANVPNEKGELVPNPYKTWKDIDSSLPNKKIQVFGPSALSGTRDAWQELAMQAGCKSFPAIAALKTTDRKQFRKVCHSIRRDGAWTDLTGNGNLAAEKLKTNADAFVILSFNQLEQNANSLTAATVNDISPEFDNIADASYPISRKLYVYIKKEHVNRVPGLKGYVEYYLRPEVIGSDGTLSELGLIPLLPQELRSVKSSVYDSLHTPAKWSNR